MVSVVASVYNCEKYIMDMIESIINQRYEDWEFIIVDDASTDKTVQIIKSYKDDRIKLIENEKNLGLTHNLNIALSVAKGKYIARIDGDDIAYSDRLEKQVDYMEKHADVVLAGCWIKSFGDEHIYKQRVVDDKTLRVQLIFDPVLFHPTFIFRKAVVDENKIYYDESLKYAQDFRFTYDMSKCGKIGNVSEILMKYRIHTNQISDEKYVEQTKCANNTRLKILNDMGIKLEKKQAEAWFKYCLYEALNEIEQKDVKHIISKIREWNDRTDYYDKKTLELLLERKLKDNTCKKKLVDNDGKVDKYQELYMLLLRYVNMRDSHCVYKYLMKRGYKKIAIYGTSYIARLIYQDLKKEQDVSIVYGIDSNPISNYIEDGFNVYQLSDTLEKVDAIVVTPFYAMKDIEKNIKQVINAEVISIEEILDAV